MCSKQ